MCTKDRAPLLCEICVGRDVLIPPTVTLSVYGKAVDFRIKALPDFYSDIEVPKYVIMPNHVHMLIVINAAQSGGMRTSRPTLQTIVRSFKTFTTRQFGYSIWQDSFYEHIVRNNEDYLRIWQYIDDNPAKWDEDEYNLVKPIVGPEDLIGPNSK